MAAPTYVDDDPEASGSATSIVFAWTGVTGEATNDLALAFLYKESTSAFTATPAGWTELVTWDQDTGGFKYRASVWWKRVSGDSGTVTWSWSGATWRKGDLALWRNCITSENPVANYAVDEETAQNDQPIHAGLTVQRSTSGLVFATWNFAGSASTPPAGYAERHDAIEELIVNDDLTTTTGASGTVTGNLVDPEYPSSILIELFTEAGAAQDTPESRGRPFGLRGQTQLGQLLAQ